MDSAGKEKDQAEDRDRIVYHTEPDSRETEISTSILMALDSIPGYDIEDSETVVFDHIDLDALDELFSPLDGRPRSGQITFDIDKYEVTATASGAITIRTKPTAQG